MKPLNAFLSRFAKATSRVTTPRGGSSTPIDIAATIEKALAAAGLRSKADGGDVIDSVARRVTPRPAPSAHARRSGTGSASPFARQPAPSEPATHDQARSAQGGVSLKRNFKNAAGARAYTLYVPPGRDPSAPMALVLMLHGCTQNPDDFATGTGMNALADKHGVLVAYPEQTRRDNGSNCWNWFRSEDQRRDAGEPSILAGIVADIAADHRVDRKRVYVTGLSAGAAMAVILGRTYPEVFAAVGAHSGLPYGAAKDMPGAFAAMQGQTMANRDRSGGKAGARAMPTIVFHGDADRTVNWSNGKAIAQDITGSSSNGAALSAESTPGNERGRRYTRESYADKSGTPVVELWSLNGGGHAWSGGNPAGSHVDATGPDASAEMLRFFLQHENAGTR